MEYNHSYVPTQEDIDAAARVLQWAMQVSAGAYTGYLGQLEVGIDKCLLPGDTLEIAKDAVDHESEREKASLVWAFTLIRHYSHHRGDRAAAVEIPDRDKITYLPMTEEEDAAYAVYFKEPGYARQIIREAWEEAGSPTYTPDGSGASASLEALAWYQGGGEVEYRSYTLKAKQDFGGTPFQLGGHAVDFGWLVIEADGTFRTPGAAWSATLGGAKRSADVQALAGDEDPPQNTYWDMLAYWQGNADKWACRNLSAAQQAAVWLQKNGSHQVRLDLSGKWAVEYLADPSTEGEYTYEDADLYDIANATAWTGALAGRHCQHCKTGILMQADPADPDQTHICDDCGGRSDGGVKAARNEFHKVATALIEEHQKAPHEPAPICDYAGEYYRWLMRYYGYTPGKAGDPPTLPEGDEVEAGKVQEGLDTLALLYVDSLEKKPAHL